MDKIIQTQKLLVAAQQLLAELVETQTGSGLLDIPTPAPPSQEIPAPVTADLIQADPEQVEVAMPLISDSMESVIADAVLEVVDREVPNIAAVIDAEVPGTTVPIAADILTSGTSLI